MTIISHILPRIPGAYTPTPVKRKKRKETGYKLHRTEGKKDHCKLTDQQVAEARWMFDFGGWNLNRVRLHYGLTYHYAAALLSGQTRTTVRVLARRDRPHGFSPAPLTPRTAGGAA